MSLCSYGHEVMRSIYEHCEHINIYLNIPKPNFVFIKAYEHAYLQTSPIPTNGLFQYITHVHF